MTRAHRSCESGQQARFRFFTTVSKTRSVDARHPRAPPFNPREGKTLFLADSDPNSGDGGGRLDPPTGQIVARNSQGPNRYGAS